MYPGELSSFGARLRALRDSKGLSQTQLARLIDRHQTAIGPYERDEYRPGRDVVEKLAGVLETTPEYLLFGRTSGRNLIPLAGYASTWGQPQEATGSAVPALLELKPQGLTAVEVADDGMAPVYRQGQIALVASSPSPPSRIIGRDALVELADGRTLLRRLAPAAEPGVYDLGAYNGPTLRRAKVEKVRPVLGVLLRSAFA